MASRVHRSLVRNAMEYLHAFREFSSNANRYLLSAFLQSVGGAMIATVFGLYVKAAGMGMSVVGCVEGAVALAAAVAALAGPPLVSVRGYRMLMLGALATLIAARLAQALGPTSAVLVGLGLTVGLGDGFLRTVNAAFLSENSFRKERTHLFSTEFLVRMAAVFVGGLAGGFLPALLSGAEVGGYQWTMGIGGAIMAAGLVPMFLIEEKVHGVKGFGRVYVDSVRHFSKWRHLGRVAAPQACVALAGGLTVPFVPLYLRGALHASVAQVGLIQGFSAVVLGIGALVMPAVAREHGPARGVAWMQLLTVPLMALVPFVGTLGLGVALLFVRNTLSQSGGPLCNEFSMGGLHAKDKPLVSGGLFFTFNMMWFVGNVLGGVMMESSFTTPYVLAAVLYAAGAALTYLLWVPAAAEHAEVETEHEPEFELAPAFD